MPHQQKLQHTYAISLEELKELMELRGKEAVEKIEFYGGIKELCKKLNTSPLKGLKEISADILHRQNLFGSNVLPVKPPKSIWQLMWEALQDVTLIVLQISALLSLALSFYHPSESVSDNSDEGASGWIEGLAICMSVIVVVLISSFNDFTKERQFLSLQNRLQTEQKFFVIRDGELFYKTISSIVVGDVCQIKYGDVVPADGIIIQSNDLLVDESNLTGESRNIKKNIDIDPVVLSGTQVMEGTGKILITAVGVNSQAGIIFGLLGACGNTPEYLVRRSGVRKDKNIEKQISVGENFRSSISEPSKTEHSVLQGKLTVLAMQIGYAGSIVAFLTVLILIIRFCLQEFVINNKPWSGKYISNFVHYFIIGVTILVVAVPEGLPLAVTLSLAYSVKKMMKDNNLVRHLDACETMGNATTICSDKTGTLTTNRMTVVQSYICEVRHLNTPNYSSIPSNIGKLLVYGISINTIYTSEIKPSSQPNELPKQVGNKTECALLGFVEKLGENYRRIRESNPESTFIHVYTFNSNRKSMSTVVRFEENGYRLYTKGASEIVLNKCKYMYGSEGSLVILTASIKNRLIRKVIEPMASDGLRTIMLAHRDFVVEKTIENQVLIDREPLWENEDFIISDLTGICIVGIEDPVRPEVPSAIKSCQTAGITVRMVTGDNIHTAQSIALKCGIITKNDGSYVLEGKVFNKLIRDSDGNINQNKFDIIWPKLRVLARSTPRDKYNLVKGIIESKISGCNEVVAVTGDGTNDGPALKKSDVGFAMGIAGTDVAKLASDIILTDDNFSSIVKAVVWGRNVYDSICKFLQFQLTVNIVAVIVAFIGACTVQETPIKAVQMLWVNLIMDTFASLALATELPSKRLLLRKPYGRTRPLISAIMLKSIIGHAIYQLSVVFFLVFLGDKIFDIPSGINLNVTVRSPSSQHFTMVFNTFVLMTLFNEINNRKLNEERNVFEGLSKNLLFVNIWFISVFAQIIIVQYGGEVFSTEKLSLDLWCWSVFFGVGTLIWGQFIISLPSRRVRSVSTQGSVVGSSSLFSERGIHHNLFTPSSTKLIYASLKSKSSRASLCHQLVSTTSVPRVK